MAVIPARHASNPSPEAAFDRTAKHFAANAVARRPNLPRTLRRRASLAFVLAAACISLPACSDTQPVVRPGEDAAVPPQTRPSGVLPPPSELYGELFTAVQTQQIYPDQKTFVDTTPDADAATIMRLYAQQKDAPGFSLRDFVTQHFKPPVDAAVTPPANQTLRAHIDWLWPHLTRTTEGASPNGSLITLPKPYVVPGGRFREGYYWDSYFTMLGLQESRPRGPGRRHARQLRVPDRYRGPCPERQSHLLREPLAAAVLRLHGGAGRREGRQRRLSEVPAGAAQGIRVLDAGRDRHGARRGHRARGDDARRRGPEPLLGCERYAARRVLPGGRADREVGALAGRLRKSGATCARAPRAAGISVRAGSATARRWRPSAPPRSCRST